MYEICSAMIVVLFTVLVSVDDFQKGYRDIGDWKDS
jgi:hypothetical protein